LIRIVTNSPDGRRSIMLGSDLLHEGDAYFFSNSHFHKNSIGTKIIYYHGKPRIARRPPWDGGLIWEKKVKMVVRG